VVSSIRWFLLIGAVLSFLQATVFFGVTLRLVEPWYRLNERAGAQIPWDMRDRRVQRGWLLFMSAVFGWQPVEASEAGLARTMAAIGTAKPA